jgi:hypothetical protein
VSISATERVTFASCSEQQQPRCSLPLRHLCRSARRRWPEHDLGGNEAAKVKAIHRIEVRDSKGDVAEATLAVKYEQLVVQPPIGKQKKYPGVTLTVIHAQETTRPKGRERIDWKLITNLPVRSRKDALEKLSWYAMRWKIETFHKILKSGCEAEDSKLRPAERIVNLIAIFCILSWRIFG